MRKMVIYQEGMDHYRRLVHFYPNAKTCCVSEALGSCGSEEMETQKPGWPSDLETALQDLPPRDIVVGKPGLDSSFPKSHSSPFFYLVLATYLPSSSRSQDQRWWWLWPSEKLQWFSTQVSRYKNPCLVDGEWVCMCVRVDSSGP